MFGTIVSALDLRCEAKTWKTWLDYILKKQKKFNLRKVSLYHGHGKCLASTANFKLPEHDIMWAQKILASSQGNRPETLSIQDVTYVIKSVTSSQIVAFNGSNYLIISRSKSILIYTLVKSRAKSEEATAYLQKIISHLVKQNH